MRTLALLLVALALPQAVLGQTTVHLSTQSRNVDFTAAIETKPFKAGTTLPAVCTVGSAFFKTDATPGQNLYGCVATNTWSVLSGGSGGGGGGGGSTLPSVTGQSGNILTNNGIDAEWRALAGDLSGAPQSAVVSRIRGINVIATPPTDGQGLVYEASNSRYAPKSIVTGVQGSTGLVCTSSAGFAICRTDDAVVPYYLTGSTAPTYNCMAGRDIYTDTTSGQFYFCAQTNTWQRLSRRAVTARTSTNTLTANGNFAGVTPIAANSLAVGTVIEAAWNGTVSATTGDMTFALAPQAAGTTVVDAPLTLGPFAASTLLPWRVLMQCTVLTTGSSGTMECSGSVTSGTTQLFLSSATRALNTTTTTDIRLNLSALAGTGTLTAVLRQMTVSVN
jgi:hypothetical protein